VGRELLEKKVGLGSQSRIGLLSANSQDETKNKKPGNDDLPGFRLG
jgi:hypothetical protein